MTVSVPLWAIPVGLIVLIWLGVFFWPSQGHGGGTDYGIGSFIEGMIRLVIGLFLTILVFIGWMIFL